jgi:monovalent cation:H+ antiporter-2, CPA2 family
MQGNFDLIVTLTGSLAAALVCGLITLRLGLSPIVGYLLAGFLVGPRTPGFVANQEIEDQLAEIGVILLMFGVGLQFHVEELLAVRRVALPGSLLRGLVVVVAGFVVGVVSGWGWAAGPIFGVALAVTSTVVAMRALSDHGELHTRAGHTAVGWLVVEDLCTVFVLVLMPAIFGRGEGGAGRIALAVTIGIAKLAIMVGLTALLGKRFIPWLFDRAVVTRSRELFTLTVLVVALGIAYGAAHLFDVSMALGAFLAGMVVGRSEFSLRAATDALPMRDAFAVLFFVSVGMLFEPRHLIDFPGLVAVSCAIVLVIKPLAAFAILLPLRCPPRAAAWIAIATAQIGEFSFILAAAAKSLGIGDDRVANTLIVVAIISITLNPILCRLVDPLESGLKRLVKTRARGAAPPTAVPVDDAETAVEPENFRAVVVGHGPIGQTVTHLLRANRIEPVVVELNIETVRRLTARGVRAIYGDANHHETLAHAGVASAACLVLSSPHFQGAGEIVRLARSINPEILIVACALSHRDYETIRQAGADVVFSGEGEVALAITEALLRRLGATPDQIDRERERVRAEILGAESPESSWPDGPAWSGPSADAVPASSEAVASTELSPDASLPADASVPPDGIQ